MTTEVLHPPPLERRELRGPPGRRAPLIHRLPQPQTKAELPPPPPRAPAGQRRTDGLDSKSQLWMSSRTDTLAITSLGRDTHRFNDCSGRRVVGLCTRNCAAVCCATSGDWRRPRRSRLCSPPSAPQALRRAGCASGRVKLPTAAVTDALQWWTPTAPGWLRTPRAWPALVPAMCAGRTRATPCPSPWRCRLLPNGRGAPASSSPPRRASARCPPPHSSPTLWRRSCRRRWGAWSCAEAPSQGWCVKVGRCELLVLTRTAEPA